MSTISEAPYEVRHRQFEMILDTFSEAVKGTLYLGICQYLQRTKIVEESALKSLTEAMVEVGESLIEKDVLTAGLTFKLNYGFHDVEFKEEKLLVQAWNAHHQAYSYRSQFQSSSSMLEGPNFSSLDVESSLIIVCTQLLNFVDHQFAFDSESKRAVIETLKSYVAEKNGLNYEEELKQNDISVFSLLLTWRIYANNLVSKFDGAYLDDKFDELREQGNTLIKAGSYAKAVAVYTKALSIKRSYLILSNRSAAYSYLKCYIEAIEDALEAVNQNCSFSVGWTRLGYNYLVYGDAEKSIKSYVKAIQSTHGQLIPDPFKNYPEAELATYTANVKAACLPEYNKKLIESLNFAKSRARQQGISDTQVETLVAPIKTILSKYPQSSEYLQPSERIVPGPHPQLNLQNNILRGEEERRRAPPVPDLSSFINSGGILGSGVNERRNMDRSSPTLQTTEMPNIDRTSQMGHTRYPDPQANSATSNITTDSPASNPLQIDNLQDFTNALSNVFGTNAQRQNQFNFISRPLNTSTHEPFVENTAAANANPENGGSLTNPTTQSIRVADSQNNTTSDGTGTTNDEIPDPDIDIDDLIANQSSNQRHTDNPIRVPQPSSNEHTSQTPNRSTSFNINPIFSQITNNLPENIRDILGPILNQVTHGTRPRSVSIQVSDSAGNVTTRTTTVNESSAPRENDTIDEQTTLNENASTQRDSRFNNYLENTATINGDEDSDSSIDLD